MKSTPLPNVSSIANISSLASLLDITVAELIFLSNNVEKFWQPGAKKSKGNGDVRVTHDAKPRLKMIHEKIKNKLLKQAYYPIYMHGGIVDHDNPRGARNHATIHCNKAILVSEDIKNFFPNCDYKNIHSIWQGFFCMKPEIAEILTKLTTYQGVLPQGWKTSSYLAHLVFYDVEPSLVEYLSKRQISYSRYIDDITISSSRPLSNKQKTKIIAKVYSTLFSKGHNPNRTKQNIFSPSVNGKGKTVTGLTIDGKKPTINKEKRNELRAAVHKLSARFHTEKNTHGYYKEWMSVKSKVGQIKASHKGQWRKLSKEIDSIKPTYKKKKKLTNCKSLSNPTAPQTSLHVSQSSP